MAITLDELKKRLFIDKHKLDDELQVQAQVQFEISSVLADLNYRQSRVENSLEHNKARELLKLKKSNVKKTVVELQSEILVSVEYQDLLLEYDLIQVESSEWQGMQEAWRQRGFALKALADLATANYYSVDTTYEHNRKAVANSKEGTTSRRRLNEHS